MAQQQRPTVGDIEWNLPASSTTTTSSTFEVDGPSATVVEKITEISTLNLEDVISPSEHESFEPVVIISPSDEYSGDIDEVLLVQTPADGDDLNQQNIKPSELISITTEEHYPNGSIVVQEQQSFLSSDDLQTRSFSINSESDSDSRGESPYQLRHHVLSSGIRGDKMMVGSSSGSDVALHEAGAELSDDEPGTNLF